MRRVIYDVLLGWKKFLQAAILLIGFVFMFASLGVQLFAGHGSPQEFCNDPSISNCQDCIGEFDIIIEASPQELLPLTNTNISIHVPRVW